MTTDNSSASFARVLAEGILGPVGLRFRRQERLARDSFTYRVCDGTAMCLGDVVTIPDGMGHRSGEKGTVIGVDGDGVAVCFTRPQDGITREMFDWEEVGGANVLGCDRSRKVVSFTPPSPMPAP